MSNYYLRKKLDQIKKDDLQLQAYNVQSNTVVMAGPGSGKTTVLTLKVMSILRNQNNSPRGLACLTYSREAAREFKSRLKLMGLGQRDNVFLGTVHSFCLTEILIPFAKLYPKYNIPLQIKIISTKEKNMLFEEVKKELGISAMQIGDMDKERLRYINGLSKVKIEAFEVSLKAAMLYEKKLIELGYLDFVSLVKLSTLMIQNEDYVQKALEAKFKWMLIDEYQDLGRPLHEMVLSLLSKTNIKIFAVGDADQSIYDFQGASPEYLMELSKWYLIKNNIHLINNYRSAKTIVEASETVLDKNRNYIAMGELKDYSATIDFYICDTGMNEQYQKAVELIKQFYTEGVSYNEIAVLVAYQKQVNAFAQICETENIPYYMTKLTFERSNFIKWLENCASWVIDSASISFDELYQYWEYLLISHNVKIFSSNRILKKRQLYSILAESKLHIESSKEWIDYTLNKLLIYSLLNSSSLYPDENENLRRLQESLSQGKCSYYSLEKFAKLGSTENQVTISSRHGSKGLEFDIVIMLGMEEGSFPKYRSTKCEIEEAHRICFVCVSRAKKKCILIRSREVAIPTAAGGVWNKSVGPSAFWNMIKKKL